MDMFDRLIVAGLTVCVLLLLLVGLDGLDKRISKLERNYKLEHFTRIDSLRVPLNYFIIPQGMSVDDTVTVYLMGGYNEQ